ncbi:transcriptional regulator [Elstera litoralis]|uniref:Transcriptional regulator n=1 Tax=Elstera litoralis TaxID=552518 RepID=A0A0F3IV66_9PROT|nr:LysR family transcriptional regulator [Elstera litoralis]KJV10576.1 transcriptional regulator [Elstera litoralis]
MKKLSTDWFLRARLKFRHLQLLQAIDDHRNMHRAAQALTMSQPAASKLLTDLETALDVRLFDRLARGLEPNWYGQVLIRHARMVLAELSQAGEELSALMAGEGGAVTIGTVMAPAVDAVLGAVESVRYARPGLLISVQIDTSDTLIQKLLDAKLDMAVCRIPLGADPTSFLYEEVGEEELCFVVGAGHPLAGRARISLEDLVDQAWVLQPRGTLLRRRIESLFQAVNLPIPRQVMETSSVFMSLAAVARNQSITVVVRSVASLFETPDRYCTLPFKDVISVEPFGLVRLRNKMLSPGASAVFEALQQALGANRPIQP